MAGLSDIANVWKNVREVDLRPIRESALQEVRIALVGAPGAGRHTLAEQLRRDPVRPGMVTQSPVLIADLNPPAGLSNADLIVLLLDSTQGKFEREQQLAGQWLNLGKKVIAFHNKIDQVGEREVLDLQAPWSATRVLFGSALDGTYLLKEFVPAVLELLPDQTLALGRRFPLFRVAIARQLISETCLSNAAYALSTGLAEIVPALNLPLNITDMIVLTKAQAFLAYRLGLLLGFSTQWQDYLTEFGSVLGSGFLWRQLARSLVGLVPAWGLVPKVAVSYAGTFVVGNTILQWYLTGRHLSREQMRGLYQQALDSGKGLAGKLVPRLPKKRKSQPLELPAAAASQASTAPKLPAGEPSKARRAKARKGQAAEIPAQVCPQCGEANEADAKFCKACGQALGKAASSV